MLERLKRLFGNKRFRNIFIGVSIFLIITLFIQQENRKISPAQKDVTGQQPLYNLDRSDFDIIEYAEDAIDSVADFELTNNEQEEVADVISSPEVTFDSYFSFEGVPNEEQSIQEMQKIKTQLPIVIQNIPTNSGLEVGARVSNPYYTDPSILLIEISGPNYYTVRATSLQNPNVVAFRDGFIAVRDRLATYNVDLTKVRFTFGTRAEETATAASWLNFLRIFP